MALSSLGCNQFINICDSAEVTASARVSSLSIRTACNKLIIRKF